MGNMKTVGTRERQSRVRQDDTRWADNFETRDEGCGNDQKSKG